MPRRRPLRQKFQNLAIRVGLKTPRLVPVIVPPALFVTDPPSKNSTPAPAVPEISPALVTEPPPSNSIALSPEIVPLLVFVIVPTPSKTNPRPGYATKNET